jgi:sortase A
MVLGIVASAWALANILIGFAPLAPVTGTSRDAPVTGAASSAPAASADASVATDPQQLVYPLDPATGEVFATLTIPALDQSFPVIEGTGADELKRGVGHLVQTAMPGEADNCIISGHRDTVFTRLGEVKKGDLLVMETATGTYTYKVSRIRIVHKDDRTVVVPTDHAVLTVSTCYPFQYVGSAPDRYVLIADLVAEQQ